MFNAVRNLREKIQEFLEKWSKISLFVCTLDSNARFAVNLKFGRDLSKL